MNQRRMLLLLLAGVALLPVGCGPSDTVTIQGAGATFPAPLYQRWFLDYYLANPNIRVNYQAIGSGAGVNQMQEDLVNFAASDLVQERRALILEREATSYPHSLN